MVACWHLWKWRNKSIFEEDFQRPNNPTNVILKMALEIDRCEQTHLDGWTHRSDTVYIGWKQPREEWFKLNCDDAHKSSVHLSGCVGQILNSNGRCVSSFTRKIGSCDAFHAEMWGTYIKMDLARRMDKSSSSGE
ncbi:ribonuclease H [Trifolium pratense]|uniref:Ribonuclease H n=1 Tax=Trifolium pratense TaxID=57577 RepID=A0A2K3L6Z4_TRIPR|nr:ribonuclease H [Trifolium pratense]